MPTHDVGFHYLYLCGDYHRHEASKLLDMDLIQVEIDSLTNPSYVTGTMCQEATLQVSEVHR